MVVDFGWLISWLLLSWLLISVACECASPVIKIRPNRKGGITPGVIPCVQHREGLAEPFAQVPVRKRSLSSRLALWPTLPRLAITEREPACIHARLRLRIPSPTHKGTSLAGPPYQIV